MKKIPVTTIPGHNYTERKCMCCNFGAINKGDVNWAQLGLQRLDLADFLIVYNKFVFFNIYT